MERTRELQSMSEDTAENYAAGIERNILPAHHFIMRDAPPALLALADSVPPD